MDLPQRLAYLLSRILGLAKRLCRLLREALSLVQTLDLVAFTKAERRLKEGLARRPKGESQPKALKIFTAVYHSSHSLNERRSAMPLVPKVSRKVSFSKFINKTSKLTAYGRLLTFHLFQLIIKEYHLICRCGISLCIILIGRRIAHLDIRILKGDICNSQR